MALYTCCILWIFGLLAQAAGPPATTSTDSLTASEKNQLDRETKLDNRIKIYDEACKRCQAALMGLMQRQEFQTVPDQLKSWTAILDASLKDIEASPGRKEKSKALIRYEIHLRRAIGAVQESKIKANVEQQDAFESWIAHSEEIHKKFVAILFPK